MGSGIARTRMGKSEGDALAVTYESPLQVVLNRRRVNHTIQILKALRLKG